MDLPSPLEPHSDHDEWWQRRRPPIADVRTVATVEFKFEIDAAADADGNIDPAAIRAEVQRIVRNDQYQLIHVNTTRGMRYRERKDLFTAQGGGNVGSKHGLARRPFHPSKGWLAPTLGGGVGGGLGGALGGPLGGGLGAGAGGALASYASGGSTEEVVGSGVGGAVGGGLGMALGGPIGGAIGGAVGAGVGGAVGDKLDNDDKSKKAAGDADKAKKCAPRRAWVETEDGGKREVLIRPKDCPEWERY